MGTPQCDFLPPNTTLCELGCSWRLIHLGLSADTVIGTIQCLGTSVSFNHAHYMFARDSLKSLQSPSQIQMRGT